ncbi:hypothetical protein DH2020_013673 [Rehmannia glutinosa]|uniref:Poly A polymerase head domain-containing protein n=1 Tax=Rehmannia glutinosa TaxID=99300 RepID=A0ABR0X674_REHGL
MALSHPLKGKTLLSRLKPFLELERFKCSFVEDGGRAQFSSNTGPCSGSGQVEFSTWRKLDSRNLGITRSMISTPSWIVLKNLRDAGFEAYLVGGCVRDLLLNKVPKDFDVITTAKLKQVSSFETVAEESKRKQVGISQMPRGCDPRDFVRWKNCMNRDFTVNRILRGLRLAARLNLSFSKETEASIYSLSSSIAGLSQAAYLSEQVDNRLGLRSLMLMVSVLGLLQHLQTPWSISYSADLPPPIQTDLIDRLPFHSLSSAPSNPFILFPAPSRLSYTTATKSYILLYAPDSMVDLPALMSPTYVAVMLAKQKIKFPPKGKRNSADSLVDASFKTAEHENIDLLQVRGGKDRRVAIMAFHMALLSNPQHAVVVLTFASLLYHRTWEESIKFARQSALSSRIYVPEILDAFDYLSDDEIAERVTQFARQVENYGSVLINKDCLLEAMTRFPEAPCSGLVFVSQKMGQHVKHIFNVLAKDVTYLKSGNRCLDIDYSLLTAGNVSETRFVLGKIILDTLLYGPFGERRASNSKKDNIQVMNPPQKPEVLEQIRHTSMHVGRLDSISKYANKRSISPSNNEQSTESASKTSLFPDNSISMDDKSSRRPGCQNSDLQSHSSVPDTIPKDEHVKVGTQIKVSLLSSLF